MRYVYYFGGGKADGQGSQKELLGGKGANLAEMVNLALPVPPGFTITTEVCSHFYKNNRSYPSDLKAEVEKALTRLETEMGAKFGDSKKPLLVSVRSGAPASMPGMMDTVLNLGLNDQTVQSLASGSGSERFAWDCYRRFVQMYGDVVLGLKPEKQEEDPFEVILSAKKKARNAKQDTELEAQDLKDLVIQFKEEIKRRTGKTFPQDPTEQLWGAIGAVFGSWENDRAKAYRRLNDIPNHWGTAVNVQSMVFGNLGDDCATGVAFTRDPSTGERRIFGEYLINAQGEDVVAGIRTPGPLSTAEKKNGSLPSLEEVMPEVYKQFVEVANKLEQHYRDMQDIEFTVQHRKLFLLQTRNGKRTARAAVKTAVDMVGEKIIDRPTAVQRVKPEQLEQLLHPTVDPLAKKNVIAKGLPASPGAAVGKVVFSADDAQDWVQRGEKVILVRAETSPEDIQGMHVSQGILTSRGGMTSHAAVVARGMGKCCVSGCDEIYINYASREFTTKSGIVIREGDVLTLDGSMGEVMKGAVPMVQPSLSGDFATFMEWVDEIRRIKVRTNADTPNDSVVARKFGAEGIGLCRTEHMFFEETRISAMREMILADTVEERRAALAKLLPMQREDFKGIFEAMHPYPVTIRLLDPPLHEFLPHTDAELEQLSLASGRPVSKLRKRRDELHEANPMLGFRGCRLAILYPEIAEMQTRAVLEAVCQLTKEKNRTIVPEIMIPLVAEVTELSIIKERIIEVARQVNREYKTKVKFLVGTMIELPRAALTAAEIAKEAEFFSFGTNDLTQMTFGLSRDDAGRFLPQYVSQHLFAKDPFMVLDQKGVGRLIEIAVHDGRQVRGDLKVGICGEHGGEPSSVKFCHRQGFDYVSCSPYRVPVARLAAAQAVLEEKQR
ncbi:MAG: pyruvate, phosphate dikinase [Bdellovibrionota bacterium]